ncbi:Protein of unknown function [Cohaesibacter sp. ES.047]|uniref:regulatory protein GemA n=1 Tax=Cohaesibacter sp. ES.047 TaxID=1798205 RepID=UPI000BB6B7B9|nr:regulatory protein GemA [Cohaesibacter sp. ES.047]SNY91374.1 Protein of unknown function [Cohaesibacter sp. ES.047]
MSAIPAIHVGLKQLGIAEEDARDLYQRQTGKRSLKVMTSKQHEAVLGELRRMGFSKTNGKKKLEGKFAPKLQALWIAAWNLGIVRDRKDSALLAFVKRQTGIDHTRFLQYPEDATKAIEALKSWMRREAGVEWNVERWMPDHMQDARYQVAIAQASILANRTDGISTAKGILIINCASLFGHSDLDAFEASDWIELQNLLGKLVRRETP